MYIYIYIYINVCSWVFNGYLNAYSKAYFDESADMCILYIYIYHIYISYIYIFPHTKLSKQLVAFSLDPTPGQHQHLCHQHACSFDQLLWFQDVPGQLCGSAWICGESVIVFPVPAAFPPCRQKKTEIFTGSANGHPLTHKMQFNGNTVGKS